MKLRAELVGVSYFALALLGGGLAWWIADGNPLLHPRPFLVLTPWMREVCSGLAGLLFGAAVVGMTRALVPRIAWARRLHDDLRPVAVGMSTPLILLLALSSSLGEELFFRAFLVPWIGVIAQAAVFGALHQVRGPSRVWWMLWAGAAGLVLGAMFQAFGSLTGPILAHAAINAANLAYLRDHDPSARPADLGGLLRT